MNKRVYISYRGARSSHIEEIIIKHLSPYGGFKAGEWGFNEGSFQCLFMFKKETLFEQFKNQLKRDLPNDFNRILIMVS